jgi:hypothetical protein
MADAATTTATSAVFAGGTTAALAVLGVEPQALAWAMVGAIFGAPLAPPAGRVRQVLVFLAVILACALLGTVAAEYFGHAASPRWRNAWCMALAGFFHPVTAVLVKAVPPLVGNILASLAQRKTGGTQ